MERVLILDGNHLPNKLRNHTFVNGKGSIQDLDILDKRLELLEGKIIESFNKSNPKLNITNVIYENIRKFRGYSSSGIYFGLISDLISVEDPNEINGDFFEIGEETYKLQVFGNVFVSYMDESSRNIFFTQIVFPELIHIIEKIQECQTFLFSDKPLYFINLVEDTITAKSIHEEAMMMQLSGFNFINVFKSGLETNFYKKNYKDFMSHMTRPNSREIIEYDYIENKVRLLTKVLDNSIYEDDNGNYRFQGSGEKFYWLTALCTLKIAFDFGVPLEITQADNFNVTYEDEIATSTKFTSTAILFNYLKKLSKGMRYFHV